MIRWIRIQLGTEVGLGPGHIVLDRNPAHPNFQPMSVVAKRLDGPRDATWYGGGPRLKRHCVRWEPSSPPPKKRGHSSPRFSAHVYCATRAQQLLRRATVWPLTWPEKWGLLSPFLYGGTESSSKTMSPGTRPTSIPSGILVHPTVWTQ